MKNLHNYFKRINLPSFEKLQGNDESNGVPCVNTSPDRATLALIMEAHSRSIPFENLDVVMKKHISISRSDIERKLVDEFRGGYCFEQNTLLQMALEELGFLVTPLLCRVRWGAPDDTKEPNSAFTHMILKVQTKDADGSIFLADVAFGGINSREPIRLDVGVEPQNLPEGRFRVAPSKHEDFHVLELLIEEEWKPLYEWRDEKAPIVDQECNNWYSCTYPTAHFTNHFFICLIIGEERHHIMDDQYIIQKGRGVDKQVTTEQITDKERLLTLVDTVFGIQLKETEGIDRFLTSTP